MLVELIEYVVKSLVDNPDQVVVTETRSGDSIALDVAVAGADVGRVIGRGGRVINAIRTVANSAAESKGKRVSIEVH